MCIMDIDDLDDFSQDYEDYHYHEDDYDDVRNTRIGKNYVHKGQRKGLYQNVFGCLKGLLMIALVVGGLAFLSFVQKACSGALAQLNPDDGEYAITDDDDYYHRKGCGCVSEDNFVDWIDLETAKEEGLEPCSYCNPPTEETDE